MKLFSCIFLMFVVSLISFQEVVMYLGFKINQDFIAANYCVEKNVETSKCEGSCRLIKMVSDTKEQPSSKLPLPNFEPVKVNLFLQNIEFPQFNLADDSDQPANRMLLDDAEFHPSVFRPPIV